VADSFVSLAAQPWSIQRRETKKVKFTAEHKTVFKGEARVRLLGLPKGVSTNSSPVLKSGTKEIEFELTATDEALLGQATGLNCEVVLTVAGEEVIQRTGRASLRIDPAIAVEAKSE